MATPAYAATAYARHSASVSSVRGIEYKAFNRVTSQLSAALEDGVPFAKLAEALQLNARLWTILATGLLAEQSDLPTQLRGQILNLAEYARRTSLKCLSGKADPRDLIELNLIIMRGLRETAGAEPEAAAPVAAFGSGRA